MELPAGFKVVSKHTGYQILTNGTSTAVQIDGSQFETMIEGDSYRVIYHTETGERYFRTKDMFGAIIEVTETSENEPVIRFRSIPDNYVGILLNGTVLVNPNKTV